MKGKESKLRHLLLISIISVGLVGYAQQSTQPQSATQSAQEQTPPQQSQTKPNTPQQSLPQPAPQPVQASSKVCLAVKPVGSHAFRNVMLFGVAGALISKAQYQVVDAKNYPARVGQKYHGNELQTLSTSGVKVVILDKHYTTEDLHRACPE